MVQKLMFAIPPKRPTPNFGLLFGREGELQLVDN